jgi:hypothetical protein
MNEFKDQVEMDTVIPTRYLESLKEVEATEIKGFKTGLVNIRHLHRTVADRQA